jgi:hypothetical protein
LSTLSSSGFEEGDDDVPFFDRFSNFSKPDGTFRPPPLSSSGFLFSSLLSILKSK